MKHGISLLPDCRPERRSATEYYEDVLAMATLADEAGMHYVKMTEHYLGNYGGYSPSPLTFLAAVAARTSRIRLMTGCVLPAFHHPIQLAAHAAMVDVLSHGRLDVGFARAWLPYEFAALGVPMDTSRDRFEKTIRAVLRLWTEDKVTEECEYFSYSDATSLPAVVQRPHPPVWGAAIVTPQSFEWLARQGMGLLVSPSLLQRDLQYTKKLIRIYLDTFEEAHQGTGRVPQVAVSMPLYVAATDAEARAVAIPHLLEYNNVTIEAADAWTHVTSTSYPGYESMRERLSAVTEESLRAGACAVVGSPETAVDTIRAVAEYLHADVCLWNIDYGGQPRETMARSMRLFVDEVLPHVTG
ncbi:LLM class flavin-dependent oxidoreductase [Dactylosporangium sucinum]|uniref:Monooxygenase n=1 Tax=Dactylosporangium sucinum TaxID=1424081 RepID=A0A917WWD0_9ACTN|nr:LLM class flavin-dependent oxidoreductase [Dactylosporangium sucinum]GGM34984.1 monooxygenase [Dactylosporangium sucinum]